MTKYKFISYTKTNNSLIKSTVHLNRYESRQLDEEAPKFLTATSRDNILVLAKKPYLEQ